MKALKLSALCLLVVLALSSTAVAQSSTTYEVTIYNLTKGQIFGPPLVVTHESHVALFHLGEPASDGIAAMAEDADLGPIMGELDNNPGVFDVTAAGGPLMPGHSVTLEIEGNPIFHELSVTQMLVTTNDAFFAISGRNLPKKGRSTFLALAYDSGSEANSESCATIPGPPCGNGFVRDTVDAEGYVYVHPGVHGIGDLVPSEHDWRNPVAKITVHKK